MHMSARGDLDRVVAAAGGQGGRRIGGSRRPPAWRRGEHEPAGACAAEAPGQDVNGSRAAAPRAQAGQANT